MIYFLINNTFHYYDARILARELNTYDCGLIQVPYSLNPVSSDPLFKKVVEFERLAYITEYLNNWPWNLIPNLLLNRSKIKCLKKNLFPVKEDILFVFSETELLNQFIIKNFQKKNCRVFLIEDGTAAYVFYNMYTDRLPQRALLLKFIIRFLYRIKGYQPFVKNGYYYPMIADEYFTGACFFLPIKIRRNIPVISLNKNIKTISNNNNNILFLTEPLYQFYTDLETYLLSVDKILSIITSAFSAVYVKCHPDEIKNEISLKIASITENYPNVTMVVKNDIIENIVYEMNVSYAISFFSTALKNLVFSGIEPIYVFHLFDYLKEQGVSKELKLYLKTINYHFPVTIDDIKPGFKSGILDKVNKGISIKAVIENNGESN